MAEDFIYGFDQIVVMSESVEHVYDDPEVDEYYREINQPLPQINGLQGIAIILTMIIAVIIMSVNIWYLLNHR